MFRFVIFGVAVSAILTSSDESGQSLPEMDAELVVYGQEVDPIILGETISQSHREAWKLQNAKYIECGLCAVEHQPFPGEGGS